MAAAAAAWVQFADASTAALAAPPAAVGLAPAALAPDLAAAVDAVTLGGLAPLVPTQLLGSAAAALQSHLAHLLRALATLFESARSVAPPAADEDEGGSSFHAGDGGRAGRDAQGEA